MITILPLTSIIEKEQTQQAFVSRLVERIEYNINELGAIKKILFRKTFDALKAVRPGYVNHILMVLTRDYINEYNDIFENYRNSQSLPADTITPLDTWLQPHKEELKHRFWKIADHYAERRKGHALETLYRKFRPTVESHLPTVYRELVHIICEFTIQNTQS